MAKATNKLCLMVLNLKARLDQLMKNEQGDTNIIAIILILAVVIALAIVFRTQLTALFNKVWSSLFSNVDNVL